MLDTVTILRGIACLIIITIHAPLPVWKINAPLGITITTIGFIGIYAFFFLSGFILGKRYLENKYELSTRGILAFYAKRFKKIAPLYYLVVIYALLNTPASVPGRIAEFIRLLTFTAPEKIHLSAAGYLWFISTIMQMYLLAPLGFLFLGFIRKKKISVRFAVFFLLLLLGGLLKAFFIPSGSYEFVTEGTFTNLYIFAAGMVFSSWYRNVFLSRSFRTATLIFIMVAFYFGFASVLSGTDYVSKLLYQTAVLPTVSFILIAFILSVFPLKQPAGNLFPLLIFQIIGIFSYEIYLFHQPIFDRFNLPCFEGCTPYIFMKNVAVVATAALVLAVGIRAAKRLALPENLQKQS